MFHEIRFPLDISRASHGGPERRTDVVVLGATLGFLFGELQAQLILLLAH